METPVPFAPLIPLVRAMAARSLSLVLGTQVQVRAGLVPCPPPPEGDGEACVLQLMAVQGRPSALWCLQGELWTRLVEGWDRAGEPGQEGPASASEIGPGTARQQGPGGLAPSTGHGPSGLAAFLLEGPRSLRDLALASPGPSFPVVQPWRDTEAQGWAQYRKSLAWFGLLLPQGKAWFALDQALASQVLARLGHEPAWKARVSEEVLGQACGRPALGRTWPASRRGPLALPPDCPLGPCILPALPGPDGPVAPRLVHLDPEPPHFALGQVWLVHHMGWEGQSFGVRYALAPGTAGQERARMLVEAAPWLLPLAQVFGTFTEVDEWLLVEVPDEPSDGWLRVRAEYQPGLGIQDVLLPADLLNELSTRGRLPWDWTWLLPGADNLVRVFLSAMDRLSLSSPTGASWLRPRAWVRSWWRQVTGKPDPEAAPDHLLADLMAAGSPRDIQVLVQNVLCAHTSLHPLANLFIWGVHDPAEGLTAFRARGFDREAFLALLPPLLAADFSRTPLGTREDFVTANLRAMELVWTLWRQKGLELGPRMGRVLEEGYGKARRLEREFQARRASSPSLAPRLDAMVRDPRLTGLLQRRGASALALGLLYDPGAAAALDKLVSRNFLGEFKARRSALEASARMDGPDAEALVAERDRLTIGLTELESVRRGDYT